MGLLGPFDFGEFLILCLPMKDISAHDFVEQHNLPPLGFSELPTDEWNPPEPQNPVFVQRVREALSQAREEALLLIRESLPPREVVET